MIAPTLSHSHIGARPSGLFAGMGVMGAMVGAARARGWQAGMGPAGVGVGGGAVSRVAQEPGTAACGAQSKAKGGKDGAEPFFMEGCGCGGECGAREESPNSQCDIQRSRLGFETDGARQQAWEVFSGNGGGSAPSFSGPGTVDAAVKLDLGREEPTHSNVSDHWCGCHNDSNEGVQNGDDCGDNGVGTITNVTPWALEGKSGMCVKGATCSGGGQCSCKEDPDSPYFAVQNVNDAAVCNGRGGVHDPPRVSCNWRESITGVSAEYNGICDCTVQCVDGTWVNTSNSDNREPICPKEERGDSNPVYDTARCPPPPPEALRGELGHAPNVELHKCYPGKDWEPGLVKEKDRSKQGSCVDNTSGPDEVLIQCCDNYYSFVLRRGSTTCTPKNEIHDDIDYVRDLSGQWWKLADSTKAAVQADGSLTFTQLSGLPWPLGEWSDTLPGARNYGRVAKCGDDDYL